MARVLIIGGHAHSLISFRGDMIRRMLAKGHEVVAMAPETDLEGDVASLTTGGVAAKLDALGVPFLPVPLQRTGVNPLGDLQTLLFLIRKIHSLKPDIVLSYTMKPVIYGSLAAWIAGVRDVYSMITGLGYVFTGDSLRQRLLAGIVVRLYKTALRHNKKIYFMNPDDLGEFRKLKILRDERKAVLINGSGVNIRHFSPVGKQSEPMVFLIIARLLWDKGIGEFVSAARRLKPIYPGVCWRIVGPFDNNPSAIRRSDIQRWQEENLVEYMGATEDVRPFIAESSVYVLPSYREGTPRSVLEAMSMGRPVITTDAPGCRETVADGVNGFLVPVRDCEKLAAAMEKFILNPALIAEMGARSRDIAENRYDVDKVNDSILNAMNLEAAGGEKRAGEKIETVY